MPEDESVDVVDRHDSVVGESTLGGCLAKGLLHRAVAVLVIRGDGKYVLQKRSSHDAWHPGLLAISSTGHVRSGETYEEAAKRELREELGLLGHLTELKKYLIPPIHDAGIAEHEWVCFFTLHTDEKCRIDRTELDGVKEVDNHELRSLLASGLLTPDSRIILTDYLGEK